MVRAGGKEYRVGGVLTVNFGNAYGTGEGRLDQTGSKIRGFIIPWPLKIQKNTAALAIFAELQKLPGDALGIMAPDGDPVVEDYYGP